MATDDHGHQHDSAPGAGHDEGAAREGHDHGAHGGGRTEIILSLACGALLLGGWLWERANGSGVFAWTLYGLAYLAGGFYTVREAIENLRARQLKIDSLMIVAAIGAAVLGQWAEGALLLFLFSLGHALENFAMGRARRAIEALAALRPETALVRRGGELVEARGEQDYLVTGVDARQQGDVESLGGAGGDGDLGVGVGGGAQGFGDAAAQPRVPHGVFVLVVPGAHGAGRLFDHVRRGLGVAGGTDRQVDGVEGQRQHEHLGQTAVRHSGRPLGDD